MCAETGCSLINNRARVYQAIPKLRDSKNHISVLLCHLSDEHAVGRCFYEWAVSEQGEKHEKDALLRLVEWSADRSPLELLVLGTADMVSYLRLLPGSTSECDLTDLRQVMAGENSENRRGVWERMLYALLSVLGSGQVHPAMLHAVQPVVEEQPCDTTEELLEAFWGHFLGGKLTWDTAWMQTWQEFEGNGVVPKMESLGMDDWTMI